MHSSNARDWAIENWDGKIRNDVVHFWSRKWHPSVLRYFKDTLGSWSLYSPRWILWMTYAERAIDWMKESKISKDVLNGQWTNNRFNFFYSLRVSSHSTSLWNVRGIETKEGLDYRKTKKAKNSQKYLVSTNVADKPRLLLRIWSDWWEKAVPSHQTITTHRCLCQRYFKVFPAQHIMLWSKLEFIRTDSTRFYHSKTWVCC